MATPEIRWNYHKLLAELGGPSGVRRQLRRLGTDPPSYQTILMWSRRNSVPSQWLAPLLYVLQEVQGKPLSTVITEDLL